jgi:hypothetical protein
MEFDQEALTSWVNMCSEERVMRESGASNDELKSMRIQIIMGMVELLPGLSPIQKSSLLVTLLSGEFAAADTSLPLTMSDQDRMALSALLSLGQGQEQIQEQIQSVDVSDPIEHDNNSVTTMSECVSDVCED